MCCPSFCYIYTRRSPVALFFRDESGFCFESQSANAVFSFRALDFFLGVRDEIGFCFGVSRRDRFFSGRAFVPVVFFVTR